MPSGFYSVFFSLNKTESLCQLGIGLKSEASQRRQAGGEPAVNEVPHAPREVWLIPCWWGQGAESGGSGKFLRLQHLCSGTSDEPRRSSLPGSRAVCRGSLGHTPLSCMPGVPSLWPGDAKPLSGRQVPLALGESSSHRSLCVACLQVLCKERSYARWSLHLLEDSWNSGWLA